MSNCRLGPAFCSLHLASSPAVELWALRPLLDSATNPLTHLDLNLYANEDISLTNLHILGDRAPQIHHLRLSLRSYEGIQPNLDRLISFFTGLKTLELDSTYPNVLKLVLATLPSSLVVLTVGSRLYGHIGPALPGGMLLELLDMPSLCNLKRLRIHTDSQLDARQRGIAPVVSVYESRGIEVRTQRRYFTGESFVKGTPQAY